jgi:hypothetical protein
MDMQQGLLCELTNEKADFEEECPDFNKVETVEIQDREVETSELADYLPTEVFERLKSEQRFGMGVLTGIGVGLLGAIIWAMITLATNYQIGYMALAIGAAVGFSMRIVGKGVEMNYAIAAAAIAVISCLLGNFLSGLGFVANEVNTSFSYMLMNFDYSLTFDLMMETFSPIDLLFYGIAGYEGFKFSQRKLTASELNTIQANS